MDDFDFQFTSHAFGLWEEAGECVENQCRHKENIPTPHRKDSGLGSCSSTNHCTTKGPFSNATSLHPPLNLLYFHSTASPSRRSRAQLIIINQWTKILRSSSSFGQVPPSLSFPPSLCPSLPPSYHWLCEWVSASDVATDTSPLLRASGGGVEAVGYWRWVTAVLIATCRSTCQTWQRHGWLHS